jgi:hypothetical protein
MGNGTLRRLLVVGASSVIRRAGTNETRTGAWVRSLLERKPARLTTVAVANSERSRATGPSVPRTPRVARAVLTRGETYRVGALAQAETKDPRQPTAMATTCKGRCEDDQRTRSQDTRGAVRANQPARLIGT